RALARRSCPGNIAAHPEPSHRLARGSRPAAPLGARRAAHDPPGRRLRRFTRRGPAPGAHPLGPGLGIRLEHRDVRRDGGPRAGRARPPPALPPPLPPPTPPPPT